MDFESELILAEESCERMAKQIKQLTEERDVLKIAHQAHETSNLRMLAKLKELALELKNEKLAHEAWETQHLKEYSEVVQERDAMKAALEKLACLGNGDSYGNSIGNCIAQEALKGLK